MVKKNKPAELTQIDIENYVNKFGQNSLWAPEAAGATVVSV